jgi:hypothetical protein
MATPTTTSDPCPSSRAWLTWSGLLIGIYLAIHFLAWQRTLIGTEVWALYYAGQPFGRQLDAIRGDLVHPPLMYMVERFWLAAFGQTDLAAKTLAMVVNLPTFVCFTWLAQRITRHWRMTSFLFLAVYLRVGAAPNLVRMYGLGLLLTVAAMALWDVWNERPRKLVLAAWTLVALLLVYTHLFGALLLVAFAVMNWLCGPRRWAFSVAACIPALAFLPWLFYVLPVYESRGLAENVWWVPQRLPVALGEFSYGLLGGFPWPGKVRMAVAAMAGVVHLVLLVFGWRMARRFWPPRNSLPRSSRWFWAAALLVGIPVALMMMFTLFVTPALHLRFVLGILPPYWLLVAMLCQNNGRAGRILLFFIVSWVVGNLGVALAKMDVSSPPRQAALLIAREEGPGDLVLCRSACNELYWEFMHHFDGRTRVKLLGPTPRIYWLSVVQPTNLEDVDSGSVERVWLFVQAGEESVSLVKAFSERGFGLWRSIPVRDYVLVLLTRGGS